ncbi:unnamed protein product, partial [Scytosiphon promiscuus]
SSPGPRARGGSTLVTPIASRTDRQDHKHQHSSGSGKVVLNSRDRRECSSSTQQTVDSAYPSAHQGLRMEGSATRGKASADDGAGGKASLGSGGESPKIFHLIKKCESCTLFRTKAAQCISKGHALGVRTVRPSETGLGYECVSTGKKVSGKNDGYKYYFRIKPGSRILVWTNSKNKTGSAEEQKVVELPPEDVAELTEISLAPGSILQRSSPTPKPALGWLENPDHRLEDLAIPPRPADVGPTARRQSRQTCPGWMWVPEDDDDDDGDDEEEEEDGGVESAGGGERAASAPAGGRPGLVVTLRDGRGGRVGGDEERGGGSSSSSSKNTSTTSNKRRRKVSSGAGETRSATAPKGRGGREGARAVDDDGDDADGQGQERPTKRRRSRRSGAGVRVTPVGSGGGLGETGDGSGSDGGGSGFEGPPMVELSTKDEVHQALARKLRECDKRDAELNEVIEKATMELERNDERRKAAVEESERQLLSIIAKREAKIAELEKLAAQERAQNNSDRESLRAHKEQQAEKEEAGPPEAANAAPFGGAGRGPLAGSGAPRTGGDAVQGVRQGARVGSRLSSAGESTAA